jgi:hypothetical protein
LNFSAVRGFNAYSQFSAKIREAAVQKAEAQEIQENPKNEPKIDTSVYIEPVDKVTISVVARNAALAAQSPLALRENSALMEFKEWAKSAKLMSSNFSQKVSGETMDKMLTNTGISINSDEEYDIGVDVWSAINVSGRNAEKARAIQDLLNSTPTNINWGFLLQKLPI